MLSQLARAGRKWRPLHAPIEPVVSSKEVVIGNIIVETEIVEQLRRCHLRSHHRPFLQNQKLDESRRRKPINADQIAADEVVEW
jgi:hypothetical protein